MSTAWQEPERLNQLIMLHEKDYDVIIALLRERGGMICNNIADEIYRQLYGGPDYNKAKGVIPFDGELPENTLERGR